jgi:hypothetical protein
LIAEDGELAYFYGGFIHIYQQFINGAAEKTRTSTGLTPTATSTLRVYQFRHGRTCIL